MKQLNTEVTPLGVVCTTDDGREVAVISSTPRGWLAWEAETKLRPWRRNHAAPEPQGCETPMDRETGQPSYLPPAHSEERPLTVWVSAGELRHPWSPGEVVYASPYAFRTREGAVADGADVKGKHAVLELQVRQ